MPPIEKKTDRHNALSLSNNSVPRCSVPVLLLLSNRLKVGLPVALTLVLPIALFGLDITDCAGRGDAGSAECCTLLAREASSLPLEHGGPGFPDRTGRQAAEGERVPPWGTGPGKSHLIPALEVSGIILTLNGIARVDSSNDTGNGKETYASTASTTWHNLVHGPWVIDNDSFGVNQLGHPYQGSAYMGIARSTGLGYWQSAGYTFVGSFLWETAGETTPPSINDMVASGVAGSFFGESLFRMASLLLERGEPGLWRELAAGVVSPPVGFNRLVFGERFDGVFPSHDPAVFWRTKAGLAVNTHTSGGRPRDFQRDEAALDFSICYGLPGKPGYRYKRPFDYFQLEFTAVSNTSDPWENVISRGLLFGADYGRGDDYRGIWGLYGSYDYLSPHTFRVSTTAVSVGTTAQWWLSGGVALQGSGLVGLGYGAAGNIAGIGQRTYHYGATGQALLDLRLIFGDLAALGTTAQLYHIHDALSTTPRGTETIGRLNVALTVRLHGQHAVGVQYLYNSRDGNYASLANQHQKMSTLNLIYTYLGDTGFGAVEWRRPAGR